MQKAARYWTPEEVSVLIEAKQNLSHVLNRTEAARLIAPKLPKRGIEPIVEYMKTVGWSRNFNTSKPWPICEFKLAQNVYSIASQLDHENTLKSRFNGAFYIQKILYDNGYIRSIRDIQQKFYPSNCNKKRCRKVEERKYNQLHVDTAHWFYQRYEREFKNVNSEELIAKVAQEMNFTTERMKEILSYPPRKVVGE